MEIDFISGDRFKGMSHYTFAPTPKADNLWEIGDYDNLQNTLKFPPKTNPCVVYTHTMYANQLLDVIRDVDCQFIIITHNSDNFVDDNYIGFMNRGNGSITNKKYFELPSNVIRWYSKNLLAVGDEFNAIPIGVENDMWMAHRPYNKKQMIADKLTEPKNFKNLVYMNFNHTTNLTERGRVRVMFEGKSWITSYFGQNGYKYEDFIDNIYNHHFVISPEGNGIDTHRTWEALYLGSIPIEKRNTNNSHFEGLPILLVDDWSEVTMSFLEKKYIEMKEKHYDMGMLTFEYWKNKILNTR